MLEVSNVGLPLDAGLANGQSTVDSIAAEALGISVSQVKKVRLLKRSVDARKKADVHFVATLGVELKDGGEEASLLAAADARLGAGIIAGTHVKAHKPYLSLDIPVFGNTASLDAFVRPVVVGAGPAGLFAALYLARAGLRPIVLERGGDVIARLQAVAAFNAGGSLDLQTNVQFGEGGAGTFSDGKLTTNIKNPHASHVLHWLVDAGAPEDILWQAKPHVGTDLLVSVVRRLREQIIELGGEVRFCVQCLNFQFDGNHLAGIDLLDSQTGTIEHLDVRRMVLACGHSARDTFRAVFEAGVYLEQKPFSVGVRIEHNQEDINRAQYGAAADHQALGAADYKLAVHLPSGRGVYTFCMCPGGEVVCAASEEGGMVVNGMSRHARDGKQANSALLVGVGPEDFETSHPLAGVDLQQQMEQAAYQLSLAATGVPYAAPAQTVGEFVAGKGGVAPSSTVQPTYARGVAWCDLRRCLPDFVADSLVEALPLLNRKMRGFASSDAVMTGVETRSSSPVRMVRDANMQAFVGHGGSEKHAEGVVLSDSGLYPCGEGAGYAGGIMSAACDGLRVAQALARSYESV